MIIGITGRAGVGKSFAVSYLLEHFKFKVFDLDKQGHSILLRSSVKHKLISFFGDHIMHANGEIDRGRLGDLVFKSKKNMDFLTQLIHPLLSEKIRKDIDAFIASSPQQCGVIVGALIKELHLAVCCDHMIVIDIEEGLEIHFDQRTLDIHHYQRSRVTYMKACGHLILNDFSQLFSQRCLEVFQKCYD